MTSALRNKEPWSTVHVDCAGRWTVNFKQESTGKVLPMKIHILTMSCAGTDWSEFAVMQSGTSKYTAVLFDKHWLCRYPRPRFVIYDNGSEFLGFEFQELITSYRIISKPTTVENPQANAIVEHTHLLIGDQLRTVELEGEDFYEELDHVVQACAWSVHTVVNTTIGHSPAQLALGYNMIFGKKVLIDWEKIKARRAELAKLNNDKENKKRLSHAYKPGDLVLLIVA